MISFRQTLAGFLLAGALLPAAAQQRNPIISFHIEKEVAETESFSLQIGASQETYIDIDYGFGLTEYKVQVADVDSESGLKATFISFQPSAAGEVKIYGDPLLIDYLNLEGVYADRLDLSQCKNLEVLNINHNLLQEFDVSDLKYLMAFYAEDNPFEISPLVIGKDHPYLQILDISMAGHIDPALNISDYKALKVFEAYHCTDLRYCDPTGCPDLILLSLDCTNVASLDVTKNKELLILNVSQTKVTDLDLSQNPNLSQLYCTKSGSMNEHYKFTKLDISNNPLLLTLFCSGNLLTELDVQGNPILFDLYANDNYLTELDLSGSPDIYNLIIDKNCMNFATLPERKPTYGDYRYEQRPLAFDRSYPVGIELDLEAQLLRPNSTTTAKLYAGSEELSDDYYSFSDGLIALHQAYPDSVHFVFSNTDLPEYDLKSSNFMIKTVEDFGRDNAMITFRLRPSAREIAVKVGILGASDETPKRFAIDFGDGNPIDFETTTAELPSAPNAQGPKQKNGSMILYIPENEDITAFEIDGVALSAIDVTPAVTLQYLNITNCGIASIDLNYNRHLRSLDLSGNSLKELSVDSENFALLKSNLSVIKANNNELTSFTNSMLRSPDILELANNQLTEFSLKQSYYLHHLDLSGNQLTAINLEDCEELQSLNVADNMLAELEIPAFMNLTSLNIKGNKIPLKALPLGTDITDYVYAPQQEWGMPAKAPVVNLSEQYVDIDGKTTDFKWYKASDNTLLASSDFVAAGTGRFRFPNTEVGEIYATWTHPAFPDFKGDDVYRSQNMTVADMPTDVRATFTTLQASEGSLILTSTKPESYVYVDWAGDGNPEQYKMIGSTYTVYPINTYEDAEVKVLTYEGEDDIATFSFSGSMLAKGDFSGLKDVRSFNLYDTGLKKADLVLPVSKAIYEMSLPGNELEGIDFSYYENLRSLVLSNCGIVNLDVTSLKGLGRLMLGGNNATGLKLDNPAMWELDLSGNKLESVDLTGVPAVSQLYLNNNLLSSVDVSHLRELKIFTLYHNYFKLTTLPRVLSTYVTYNYSDQYPWDVKPINNVVDLSEQLMVGTNRTSYRWFRDDLYYNEEGNIVGDEMVPGEDYEEKDGIFTFLRSQHNARCLLVNAAFPNIVYVTMQMDIETVGVEAVEAEGTLRVVAGNGSLDIKGASDDIRVYTIDGRLVTSKASAEAHIEGLQGGIYVVASGANKLKVRVK